MQESMQYWRLLHDVFGREHAAGWLVGCMQQVVAWPQRGPFVEWWCMLNVQDCCLGGLMFCGCQQCSQTRERLSRAGPDLAAAGLCGAHPNLCAVAYSYTEYSYTECDRGVMHQVLCGCRPVVWPICVEVQTSHVACRVSRMLLRVWVLE